VRVRGFVFKFKNILPQDVAVREGRVVRPPRAAEPKGGKETILNEKVLILCAQKNYKLLSQIKRKPINN